MSNKRLLLATTIIAGTIIAAPAFAQEQPPSDSTEVGELIITGSRIARINVDAPVPVAVVDRTAIEGTGQVNIGDLINQLPAAGVSGYTAVSTGFATAQAGVTAINLRNLGSERTLVLMNGRRYVAGVPGTQIVDFSTMPSELIDRIEVVTGGASAVYGSDALAGVVNIITKKNFTGLEASGQFGLSERDDDERTKLTLTAGANFADDKGNAVISLGYNKVGSIFARDRGDRGMAIDAVNGYDGINPATVRDQTAGGFSTYSLYGYLDIPSTDPNGGRVGVYDNGVLNPYTGSKYGFNRQSQRLIAVPYDQYTVNAFMNYQVRPWAEFFTELSYARTESHSENEAFPLDSSDLYADTLAYCDTAIDSDPAFECGFGIPLAVGGVSNVLIPDAVRTAVRAESPLLSDDDLVVGFRRRIAEVALRSNDAERQTFRLVTGFRGDIAPNLRYEISANYGRTDDDQTSTGDVDVVKFANAVDAIILPNGQVGCRDAAARAAGCAPLNIFGLDTISDEAGKYVAIPTSRDASIEQYILNGFVSGDVPGLSAGRIDYVLGAEYREEDSRDTPDAITQAGQASGNATPETIGGFNVTELFAEARIPLLADKAWVKALDFNLAARVSSYSTVGNTVAYAGSLEYRPTDWLKVRGQYSRAVRAPNISELFQPAQQDFPSVNDPCAGVTRSGGNPAFFNTRLDTDNPANVFASGVDTGSINDPVAVACLGDPLVAARVARDGGFALTIAEEQGVSGFERGNPNLEAETADTYTFGLVFNPRWNDAWSGLTSSVDYYDIDISDRIIQLEQAQLVQLCYSSSTGFDPANPFCSAIRRFQVGSQLGALQFVDNVYENFASTRARGMEIQVSYRFGVDDLPFLSGKDWGDITATLNWNHVFELKTVPFEGATPADFIVEDGAVGAPQNEAQASIRYSKGPFAMYWNTQYIGSGVIDTNALGTFYNVKIKEEFFHDVQVSYDVRQGTEVYFGVNNLFDNYSFIGGTNGTVAGTSVIQTTGWTTFPEVYDGIGRRFYGGVRLKF